MICKVLSGCLWSLGRQLPCLAGYLVRAPSIPSCLAFNGGVLGRAGFGLYFAWSWACLCIGKVDQIPDSHSSVRIVGAQKATKPLIRYVEERVCWGAATSLVQFTLEEFATGAWAFLAQFGLERSAVLFVGRFLRHGGVYMWSLLAAGAWLTIYGDGSLEGSLWVAFEPGSGEPHRWPGEMLRRTDAWDETQVRQCSKTCLPRGGEATGLSPSHACFLATGQGSGDGSRA